MKNIICLCLVTLFALCCSQRLVYAMQNPTLKGSVGFWYASNPPLSELAQFDYLVLEPAHFDASARDFLHSQNTQLFAYLSVGEFDGNQQALADAGLDHSSGDTVNHAWDSHVMNLADEKWQDYLAARAQSLLVQGYDGLFLDTLDSFQLLPAKRQEQQRQGLLQILTRLQTNLPDLALIFNRGFEVVHELPKKTSSRCHRVYLCRLDS